MHGSQGKLDRGGIQAIDGSPDESHYAFHGGAREDVFSLVAMCLSALIHRGQSVAFAESLTGGMLSDLWHGEADAQRAYGGSVVVSGGGASCAAIGMTEIFLANFSFGSREVALAMASGVKRILSSDFTVAIAAAVDGRSTRSDCAAWLAIRTPSREIVQHVDLSSCAANRTLMRERACYAAFKIFLQVLFEES